VSRMDRIDRAVRELERGGVVVYPTDTLYGLGARLLDRRAVDRVNALKQRPPTTPLSFAVSSHEEVERYARLAPAQRAKLREILPGRYTLLLPSSRWARAHLPRAAQGPGGSVGIRIPDHPVARELARRAGPIVSTSVNRHGAPPARTLAEAVSAFGKEVSAYVDGGPPPSGQPSTILDLVLSGRKVR
jgi:L-threonylcarbamoyladenylate synthase